MEDKYFPYALIVLLVLFLTALPVSAENITRLSDNIIPQSYDLDIKILPNAKGFSGTVSIKVDIKSPTKSIILHSKDLSVSSVEVETSDKSKTKAKFTQSAEDGVAAISADQAFPVGQATLTLKYSGTFKNSLHGLYISKNRHNGKSYAVTQMEPIYARRVFPSFDEPRFKTPYSISITHHARHQAISNGPEEKQTELDGTLIRTRFAKTKPLPTYLIALTVGDYDVVDWPELEANPVRNRPLKVRGIAPKGDPERLLTILEYTKPILDDLETWFDIPYPYAKLDLIAARHFSSAGMENAGAIIYRADSILLPQKASVYSKNWLAELHAHELAHSWFGNYVTPQWWDDIWLNESFATWMASKALTRWQPDRFPAHLQVRSAMGAVWNDRFVGARAIHQPANTDSDIVNAFDSTSYTKGGAVLSMLEQFIGKPTFRKAVQEHIKARPHGNASTADFLATLERVANKPGLVDATNSYLQQPGVPLLSAKLNCGEGKPPTVKLSQRRYFPLGSKGDENKQWKIPLCIAWGDDGQSRREHCQIVTGKETEVTLPTKTCPAWVMPNSEGAAYLLFDLDPADRVNLLGHFEKLNLSEQIATSSSIMAAYTSGKIDTKSLFEFATKLAASKEWDVASTARDMFNTVRYGIAPNALRPKLDKLTRDAFAQWRAHFPSTLESFASVDPDPVKAKSRSDLFWFLALDADDKELLARFAKAGHTFSGYNHSDGWQYKVLHPNFVRLGLSAAVLHTGKPFAQHLIKRLGSPMDYKLRNSVLAALGESTDPETIKLIRGYVLADKTPASDVSTLLRYQTRRRDNGQSSLDWVTKHYDQLLKILPSSEHPWMVWRTASSCSIEASKRIESFFRPRIKKLVGAERALNNVLENVSLCAGLTEGHRTDAISLLKN